MARLPDISLETRPTPRSSKGIAQMRTRTGFEDIPARVQAQVGADVQRLGQVIFNVQEDNKKERVESLYNKFLAKKLELAYGDNGYTKKTSDETLDDEFISGYQGQLAAAGADLIKQTKSQDEAGMLQKRIEIATLGNTEDLYRISAANAIQRREQNAADALKYAIADNDMTLGKELGPNFERALSLAKDMGGGPDTVKFNQQAVVDSILSSLVQAHVKAGNIAEAKDILIGVEDGFTAAGAERKVSPALLAELKERLKMSIVADKALRISNTLETEFGPGVLATDKRIREEAGNDPQLIEMVRSDNIARVNRFNAREKAETVEKKASLLRTYVNADEPRSIAELTQDPVYQSLDPDAQQAMLETILHAGTVIEAQKERDGVAKTRRILSNPKESIDGESPLDSMTEDDLIALRTEIGQANVDLLVKAKADRAKLLEQEIDIQLFNRLAQTVDKDGELLGLFGSEATRSFEQNLRHLNLLSAVNHDMAVAVNDKKRELSLEEQENIMQPILDREALMDWTWPFSDEPRPGIMLLEDDDIIIPTTAQKEAINLIRKKHTIPNDWTDGDILDEYEGRIDRAYRAGFRLGFTFDTNILLEETE